MFDDWSLALAAYNCGPAASAARSPKPARDVLGSRRAGARAEGNARLRADFFATLDHRGVSDASYGFKLESRRTDDAKEVELEGPVSLRYLAGVAASTSRLLKTSIPNIATAVLPPAAPPCACRRKAVDAVMRPRRDAQE
jgi:hypothetical protein